MLTACCTAELRAALRVIERSGMLLDKARTMARACNSALASTAATDEGPSLQTKSSTTDKGSPLARALQCHGRAHPAGLTAATAAKRLGYVECASSFTLDAAGHASSVVFSEHEELPAAFRRLPYARLQAFDTACERGWGVRCTQRIARGTVVMEVAGRAEPPA